MLCMFIGPPFFPSSKSKRELPGPNVRGEGIEGVVAGGGGGDGLGAAGPGGDAPGLGVLHAQLDGVVLELPEGEVEARPRRAVAVDHGHQVRRRADGRARRVRARDGLGGLRGLEEAEGRPVVSRIR